MATGSSCLGDDTLQFVDLPLRAAESTELKRKNWSVYVYSVSEM